MVTQVQYHTRVVAVTEGADTVCLALSFLLFPTEYDLDKAADALSSRG